MLREFLENIEYKTLAPYAVKSAESRGRKYIEPKHPFRTEFQRDRDRVVHSTAFRRLQYKTQVFVNHEGDHYRTRLTHTIEVDLISRSVAKALRLNEDLAEALALAHDLGHTPFGHSGEDALNEILADKGGFEHNRQCLRVVDLIEVRYPDFPGLNLTYELREGILKHHNSLKDDKLPSDLNSDFGPTLESQVVNIADEIAYNCHDIDDGLASGILAESQLADLPVWREGFDRLRDNYPRADGRMRRHYMVRHLINYFVSNLVENSGSLISAAGPSDAEEIRRRHLLLIAFSDKVSVEIRDLKEFLNENLYKNERLLKMADKARRTIRKLYSFYRANPDILPENIKVRYKDNSPDIVVADYIAGMTDRFASSEFDKIMQQKSTKRE